MAQDEDGTPPPPSFAGKLKLQDFMFKTSSSTTVELRRSPRRAVQGAAAASDSPAPSPARRSGPTPRRATGRLPSPLKRKTLHPDPDLDSSAVSSSGSSSTSTPRTSSASPEKKKRKRPAAGYAPPSTYAYLSHLPDALGPNLLVLFVGLNPGIQTAVQGHAYAHPTNLFWRLLHSSGTTPRLCAATEDRDMPALYSLGLTNIVARPSRNGAELSKAEMDAGVGVLEAKARRWRPECVCIVGKSIWESVWRVRHGKALKAGEFRYGWQDEGENMGVVGEEGQVEEEREAGVDYGDGGSWAGARVFVATSTSGLAATLKPPEKERIWRELGVWVEQRRAERADMTGSSET